MHAVRIGFLGSVDVSLEWTSEDGLGEDNDRDLLVFTPVHMDWAADRHFAEFSLDFTLLKICHSSGGKRVSIRRGG